MIDVKQKKLEHNPEIQKRLEENQTIEKNQFSELLRKAVKSSKPSSQPSV
jgi:hypothetical protein